MTQLCYIILEGTSTKEAWPAHESVSRSPRVALYQFHQAHTGGWHRVLCHSQAMPTLRPSSWQNHRPPPDIRHHQEGDTSEALPLPQTPEKATVRTGNCVCVTSGPLYRAWLAQYCVSVYGQLTYMWNHEDQKVHNLPLIWATLGLS